MPVNNNSGIICTAKRWNKKKGEGHPMHGKLIMVPKKRSFVFIFIIPILIHIHPGVLIILGLCKTVGF